MRSGSPLPLPLLFVLALGACATYSTVHPGSLSAHLGRRVELHGTLMGPGKAGFYVEVDGESILLDVDDVALDRMGHGATVRGRLGFETVAPPAGTDERVPVREGYTLTDASIEFDP